MSKKRLRHACPQVSVSVRSMLVGRVGRALPSTKSCCQVPVLLSGFLLSVEKLVEDETSLHFCLLVNLLIVWLMATLDTAGGVNGSFLEPSSKFEREEEACWMGQGQNFPDPSNTTARVEYQRGSTVLAYHCQLDRCVKPTDANRRCAGTCDSEVSR